MKRNEACALLTKIASSEMIDNIVSKELLKARDIVVCEPHKVLDVLATDEARYTYSGFLHEYLCRLFNTNLLSHEIGGGILKLDTCLSSGFEDGCDEMYLPTRCKTCPNFKGNTEC